MNLSHQKAVADKSSVITNDNTLQTPTSSLQNLRDPLNLSSLKAILLLTILLRLPLRPLRSLNNLPLHTIEQLRTYLPVQVSSPQTLLGVVKMHRPLPSKVRCAFSPWVGKGSLSVRAVSLFFCSTVSLFLCC